MLDDENLLALQRNESLMALAAKLADAPLLRYRLQAAFGEGAFSDRQAFGTMLEQLATLPSGESFAAALSNPVGGDLVLVARKTGNRRRTGSGSSEKPRQLVGQPAATGLATGVVRLVETADDLGRFCAGEVMVCPAIEPTKTHLVPLASAIVERRGGMLIHGAIIARELGIPCVNGIAHVLDYLGDVDLVTVDGHLGVVSVGKADFDMEGIDLSHA